MCRCALRNSSRLFSGDSGAAKAAGAAHALLQVSDLDNVGSIDALKDELSYAVSLCDGEIGIGVVEEQDLDLTTVVSVDDAGARVNEVLGRQAGARSDTAIWKKEIVSAGKLIIPRGNQGFEQ